MTDRVKDHFGNYQLVQLLGKGGYAEVYLGKHRYLNSYAALKVLYATLKPDNEHKFLSEAQRLVDLRHANIVHLLDFGIESGTPVLIMDYAPNGSLRQRYPHGMQMPLTTIVDSVAQIAAALQYAHNHNVIHRDVKPENILLDADNRLLLSDFGLSLLAPSPQQLSTQDPAGTPRYMAPEQLRGKPCFASDQYALAVMVYEWLCGELPFRGNLWEIWYQHMHTDPPPLRVTRPELPLMLEQIVLRALAKKPQDRFVSIQAFALALTRASRVDIPLEEHDLQVTAPLPAVPRSSPVAPPYHTALPAQISQREQMPSKALAPVTTEPPPAPALQDQNRVRMLGRLRRSYSDLMSQSLEGAAWLELGLASVPQAVQNATNLLLHVENKAAQHLPAGASIKDAYDEAEHELLILGEPGAGKSTLLLGLAQQLVVRAEQDKVHPLPVILPLSSWAVKRPPLQDWIAEQLAQIYDVPRKLSVQWVEEDHVLPLLDGLDEMEETARSACIAAINTYHRDHLAQLVVCSRTNEYEAAASRQRLALQGAVIVQPLTHSDVDAYLQRAGQPLAALRSALKKNNALHDLATTPLMLNILILTYQGTLVHDLPKKEAALLQQVWDDYVGRMVMRKGNSKRYPLRETREWLSFLAGQMRSHNQTVFYLEHLQSDWLETKQRPTYVWRAIRLPAIFIGALISTLVYLFFFGSYKLASLSSCLQYGVLGGLLGGLWRRSMSEKGRREKHHHMWAKRLAISACIGLFDGLTFGLFLSSFPNYTLDQLQAYALSYGVVMGLLSLLLQYLLTASFHLGMFPGNNVPQRWKGLVRFGSVVQGPRALLVAVVIGLSHALAFRLTIGSLYGSYISLSIGVSFGLISGLISLTLSRQMEDIRPTDRLRWTWRSLGSGLFNSRHLRTTAILTSIIMIVVILRPGLAIFLHALSIGLTYWCLLGLLQGIAQEQVENQDRRIANEGIHRSLHNSVIMGLISGTMIGTIGILNHWVSIRLSSGLTTVRQDELISGLGAVLSYGLFLGLCGALLICILTGGLAAFRHYIIRFLLWRSRTFPWRAPQFLNDATARFLLRRVGGGYSFTHRLLLDHLADVGAGATPQYRSS